MAETLTLDVGDAQADAQLFMPGSGGPHPAVLFFPDAGGVRPALERMAERLASVGYVVLLPNVYHRQGAFAPFDFRTVFEVPSERDRLMALARSLDGAKLLADVGHFLAALAARPEVRGARVGTVGYCMGGRHALLSAVHYPEQVAAVSCIHGGGLVTDAPDSPHRRIASVQAELYFGVADKDRACTPEQQGELCRALAAAGKRFTLEHHAGAAHGFAVPDAPVYEARAAERHFQRTLALFADALSAP